jgi:cathepsin F
MKVLFAIALLALFCLVSAQPIVSPYPLSDEEVKDLFTMFTRKYEVMLGSEEEFQTRFAIFKDNVEKARVYNQLTNSNTYGVTKFSHLTEDEFANRYLSKKIMSRADIPYTKSVDNYPVRANLPTAFDWREKGAVTPPKNQGACGSCWAFSTTGNVEGQHFLKTGNLVSLSEQQLVDCDKNCDKQGDCDAGCNGGLMWNAFQYIIDNKGISSEQAYPYEARDNKCRFQPQTVVANISSWEMLPQNETELAQWLVDHGPVSIGINAAWMQMYVGGISDPLICDPKHLNHGVLLVGFGWGKSLLGKEEPYWIIKNSWGSGWGEKGFMRIVRNKGKCGLNLMACSALA